MALINRISLLSAQMVLDVIVNEINIERIQTALNGGISIILTSTSTKYADIECTHGGYICAYYTNRKKEHQNFIIKKNDEEFNPTILLEVLGKIQESLNA